MAWFCSLLLIWLGASFGPPGPNSGHLQEEHRGEGFDLAMGVEEEDGSYANHTFNSSKVHGAGHQGPLGASSQSPHAVKRSLRRAYKRANLYGWTVYKGQILKRNDLDPSTHMSTSTWALPEIGKPARSSPRTVVLSWNCGGLTTELYQETLAWLQHQDISILLLQGARWRDERVWTAGGYNVIQSGEAADTKHAHAGLLTFVSQKFCAADDISYAVLEPGRLLHVRCRIANKAVDVVNVYQHPDTTTTTRTKPMEARSTLWAKLEGLLHGLAHPNIFLMGGDFNCTLPGHGPTPANPMPDVDEFAGIVKIHHLHSIRTHDGTPSFVGAAGQPTIDFVVRLTRVSVFKSSL